MVQPYQFAAFGNLLAKKLKALIVAAGTLREKKLGFITLDLGAKVNLVGGDEIKQYLTLTISWDGSYRFAVVAMDYRTVCANTYPSPDCQAIWEARKVHGFSSLPVSSPFDPDQVSDFIADQYEKKVAVNKQKYSDVIGNLVSTNFDGARDKNLLRFASIMADGKSTLNRIVDLHDETQSASFLDRCLAATIDKDAWDNVRTNGCASGHVRPFLGRLTDQTTINAAWSHEPQANTTYATNRAMLNLWTDPENRRPDGTLIIEPLHQVHDELDVQWPQEVREWARAKMKSYFANDLTIAHQQIRIPFEGKFGPSWGECKTPI